MSLLAHAEDLLSRWSEERSYFISLSLLTVLVAGVASVFALDLHRNFITVACDTAAFQSTIVNTLDGHWFRDTAYDGPNYLGLHCIFMLIPIASIYAIFPSPDLLFILQVCLIYSSVIPLYLVTLEIARKPIFAFLTALAGLASPFLLNMAVSPFHPESWIITAVLWSFWFYRRNYLPGFWISMGFGLSCGEQAALIYTVLGAIWLICDDGMPRRKRFGLYACGSGFAWLALCVGIIIPHFHQAAQVSVVAYNYSNWNIDSFAGLARAVLHQPRQAFTLLFAPDRWLYVLSIVGWPLWMAFLSWRAFILLAPMPLYLLMNDQEFFLYFHTYYYQCAFLAGFLGLIFVLGRLEKFNRIGISLLGVTLILNVLMLFPATAFYLPIDLAWNKPFNDSLHQAFEKIPPRAGVYAPHRYSAYLSNRDNMVMGDLARPGLDFNTMVEAQFPTTSVHSGDIDYIVCDVQNDQCGPRLSGYDPDKARQRIANVELLEKQNWQAVWNQNDIVILHRSGK